jgi:hypothetical protein
MLINDVKNLLIQNHTVYVTLRVPKDESGYVIEFSHGGAPSPLGTTSKPDIAKKFKSADSAIKAVAPLKHYVNCCFQIKFVGFSFG